MIGSLSSTDVRSIVITVREAAVAASLFHVSTMPKPPGDNSSLREHFAWTYGTLAMVHAAVEDGKTRYKPVHFIIRGRFRHGFLSEKMRMRPLHDDEKTKIAHATTCCYCGREAKLSLDHLIPKLKGGPDAADNITYACRSCNSSKGPKDMVLWLVSKGRFPAILVFRRYLKLAARWCEDAKLMETSWADVPDASLPFDKRSLRVKWPEPSVHRLWPDPPEP
ncbi:MAG: HNH endonuclease [Gemmatimonadetes bacterium]|nr:HNH endonuclease [Gemmatimonadota bacterium]